MKLIINNNGLVCYTQIKDIAYLTEYTGNENYLKKYIELVNQGFDTNSFIRVNDTGMITDLINCLDIIDYMEYKHTDAMTVSRTVSIAMKNNCFGSYQSHKLSDELRTLMEYKSSNGALILPPIPDGEYYYSNGVYEFYSIPLDGFYVISGENINEENYRDFLEECISNMDGEYTYKDTFVDGKVFVRLITKKKRNLFGLGKKKKNS